MTDPQTPCCSEPASCCGAPGPAPKRTYWKTIIFIIILLLGVALAAHTLMGKKEACSTTDCSTSCQE